MQDPNQKKIDGPSRPLAIDLDGTLIKSDLLYEALFISLSQRFWIIFLLPFWLFQGKAYLKSKLCENVKIPVELLPINMQLMSFLITEHQSGRSIYLATASNEKIAQQICSHFLIFDGFFASDIQNNLKGQSKADMLVHEFGEKGFDYAGNSTDDLAVWKVCHQVIAVNCSRDLVTGIKDAFLFDEKKHHIKDYFKLVRVKQWTKNSLVYLPMFAGHQIDVQSLVSTTLVFFCFSMCASSIYIINDLFDLNNDRAHNLKKYRPIASGKINIPVGILVFTILFISGTSMALCLSSMLFFIMAFYILTSVAYTIFLKKIAMIDVITLSILYLIRVSAGVEILDLNYSPWLFGFLMFIFLTLSLVKRISEIKIKINDGIKNISGRGYYVEDLPVLELMATASAYSAAVIFYLYINSEKVKLMHSNYHLLWVAMPILVYWLSRVLLKSHRGEIGDDPLQFVLTDKVSLLVGLVFIFVVTISALL